MFFEKLSNFFWKKSHSLVRRKVFYVREKKKMFLYEKTLDIFLFTHILLKMLKYLWKGISRREFHGYVHTTISLIKQTTSYAMSTCNNHKKKSVKKSASFAGNWEICCIIWDNQLFFSFLHITTHVNFWIDSLFFK